MANGIKRRGAGFLAKESVFGTEATTGYMYIPTIELTEAPTANVVLNTSMAGSSYQNNAGRVDTKLSTFSITFKVTEDLFPLLLLNKYTIASAPVSGDTNVIRHAAVYNGRNVGTSYTLRWVDLDRPDQAYVGFVPHTLNWTYESPGYIQVTMTGRANFPKTATASAPAITATPEFVSKNGLFLQGINGASPATFYATALSTENTYGEPEDTDEIPIGSEQRQIGITTVDNFTITATANMPDYAIRDAYEAGQNIETVIGCEDTTRIVTGSTTNINPSIKIEAPAGIITEWAPEGDADTIWKQTYTINVLDKAGEADAPHKITILNNIASY